MTIRETKLSAIKVLRRRHDNEAPIDAEILLAHCLGITREKLLTHTELPVPAPALRRFRSLLARRAKHEPIAYLTGHKEFFGLQFDVNKHTLIPRPETELLVEEALSIIKADSSKLIVDIGTGSGAIAIAIAKNCPEATVIAADVSKPALKMAEHNAANNDVAKRVIFQQSDLLLKVGQKYPLKNSIIVANLPYLPTKVWQKCAPDVKKFEPKSALVSGPDGLGHYDRLLRQVNNLGIKATIICEIDPSQKKSFPKLVERHFPGTPVAIKNDLAKLARIAVIKF